VGSTPIADDRVRVALVTGAAGGLGPACCRALAARGLQVLLADLDADGAARVADGLDAPAGARGVALDVTDEHAVASLIGSLDRLDVVVNLAGVIRRAPLTRITLDDFRLTMATHAEGTLSTMREAAPLMRANGYGRIVNTSSIAIRGSVAGGSYGAAKGAIEGLTHSAAIELAPHGITVNCVSPGLVDAGIFLSTPEQYRQELIERVPMRRLGTPEDVSACVAFLASEEAGYITGQTLTVCGGLSLGF
jgi:3-oxoacyl-[acyl-carrier protein] reductase